VVAAWRIGDALQMALEFGKVNAALPLESVLAYK
jgi:hypothetical protein